MIQRQKSVSQMIIKKIDVRNHPIFGGFELELFKDRKVDAKENYRTIVIGPNGTGKSHFISCFAEILIAEFSRSKEKASKTIPYDYNLITQSNHKTVDEINKKSVNPPKLGNIIAFTNTFNDRFHFPSKNGVKNSEKYKYMGLKSASNNIFFSNIRDSILKSLKNIINNPNKLNPTKKVLTQLGKNTLFKIKIDKGRYFSKFEGSSTSSSEKFGDITFKRVTESVNFSDKISEIEKLTNDIKENKTLNIEIDLDKSKNCQPYTIEAINLLVEAKILSITKLSIENNIDHDLNNSSSGELNIIRTFLSIISQLEDNSLILIDEPEISLHPNWQVNFCALLDTALEGFTGCHTFIATHSHFILSSNSDSHSNVLRLKPDISNKVLIIEEFLDSTHGASAEFLLYKYFGITGFENKFVEMDISTIIMFLSDKKNPQEFKMAFERISQYKFSENSHTNILVTKAKFAYDALGSTNV